MVHRWAYLKGFPHQKLSINEPSPAANFPAVAGRSAAFSSHISNRRRNRRGPSYTPNPPPHLSHPLLPHPPSPPYSALSPTPRIAGRWPPSTPSSPKPLTSSTLSPASSSFTPSPGRTSSTAPSSFFLNSGAGVSFPTSSFTALSRNAWSGVDSLRTTNFSEFVTHLCKFGDVGEMEWVHRMAVSGGGVLTERNYVVLVGALCKKDASLTAMEEKGLEPVYFTYLVFFQCLCRNGKLYEADIVLRIMYCRRWRFDVCVYASFLHGLCKSGKWREANKLFRKLIDRDHKSSGYSHLKMGRRVIFQLDCRGLIPATLVYECYFRSLCSVGRLADAEKLLKEMMGMKYVPEFWVHSYFIRTLVRAGRVDDARKYSNVLRKKDFVSEDDIVVSLIDGFFETGKTDAARELLDDHIGSLAPISHLCNRVLGSYWKGGRIGEAIHLFERMKSGHYGRLDFSAYNTMFNGFIGCGQVEKAVLIFQEMVEENVPVSGALHKTLVTVTFCHGNNLMHIVS